MTSEFGPKKGNGGYRGEQGEFIYPGLKMGKGQEITPAMELEQHRVCSPGLRLNITAWLASTHLYFSPSLSSHLQTQHACGQVLVGTAPNLCHP